LGRTSRQHIVSLLVAAASSFVACLASAQSSTPEKLAVARALFDQATTAMDRKDYATACPKLEEVVRLVPDGVGASIALGECYEGAGRLASAWTTYIEAESTAGRTNQSARQKEAREHAEKVQPRLAKLTVAVPEGVRTLPGLSVTRDGLTVSSVEWGVPVPVDKGKHAVVVTATGKQRWEKTLDIQDGAPQVVTLEVPADGVTEPRKDSSPGLVQNANAAPEPRNGSSLDSVRKPIGFAALGVGAAGLAVGGIMAGLAGSKHSALLKTCPTGHCAPSLQSKLQPDVDSYHTLGNVSTASFIAGGAVAATGLILVLTAPAAKPPSSATVSPIFGLGYAGMEGTF
jgi:hypothetical protein